MDFYKQNQDLLLIKLSSYSFPYGVIEFIQSYLNYYSQRVNMNGRWSEWCKTLEGVPQRPITDTLLLNISANDIFTLFRRHSSAIMLTMAYYIQFKQLSDRQQYSKEEF